MADIITVGLGIRDDGTPVIKEFGDASEKAAGQTDRLEAAVRRSNGTLSNGSQRAIGEARQVMAAREQMTGALTAQTDAEFFAARIADNTTTAHVRAGAAAAGHGLSTNKLTRALEGMVVSAIGANPHLAQLAATMSHFALGGPVVVGILAGLAAAAFAWEKYTAKLKEAQKEQDAAVKQGMQALQLRSLGAGGESANTATAALGRIEDLKKERESVTSLYGRIFESGYVIPAQQQKRLKEIDDEINSLGVLAKAASAQNDIARAKQFATSVTTPFDYAEQRGNSLDGFYKKALASERELTELAKSGTFEVRDAAISALGNVEKIIDRVRLIQMGLSPASSRLGGVEAGVFAGAASATQGALTGQINMAAQHGTSISNFADEAKIIADAIGEVSRHDIKATTGNAFKTSVQASLDALDIVQDAIRMAGATPSERAAIAASVRNGARTSGSPELANLEAQKKYGQSLSDREASLKLPPAFDAVREAAVRHGETMRNLTGEFDVAKQAFTSMTRAVGSFKEGLLSAATGLLQQLSPSNIAQGLVNGAVQQVEGWVKSMVGSAVSGIRHAVFGESGAEKDAARQAEDSARAMALGLDAVTMSLQGNVLGATINALQISLISTLQAINNALPGTKNEAERNAARAQAAAQEAQQEANARRVAAEQAQYANEDLAVRNLRATGQGSQADMLSFQNQQAREMQAAIDANRDATYLSYLATVQNNELIAYQNGLLATALRNAPTGFYGIEGYAGAFATPRGPAGYPTDSGPVMGGGADNSNSGLSPRGGRVTLVFQKGALVVDKDGMMNVVLDKIDQQASGSGGSGSSRASALELMRKR